MALNRTNILSKRLRLANAHRDRWRRWMSRDGSRPSCWPSPEYGEPSSTNGTLIPYP